MLESGVIRRRRPQESRVGLTRPRSMWIGDVLFVIPPPGMLLLNDLHRKVISSLLQSRGRILETALEHHLSRRRMARRKRASSRSVFTSEALERPAEFACVDDTRELEVGFAPPTAEDGRVDHAIVGIGDGLVLCVCGLVCTSCDSREAGRGPASAGGVA